MRTNTQLIRCAGASVWVLEQSFAACGEWVAVWNDYPDATRELAAGTLVDVRAGSESVTISRRNCAK